MTSTEGQQITCYEITLIASTRVLARLSLAKRWR